MKDATRTAGNIACGTFEQVLSLMNAGIAYHIVYVLDQVTELVVFVTRTGLEKDALFL